MSTSENPQPNGNGLVAIARAMGRSRVGQLFGAIIVAVLSAGIAWLVWNHRNFAAFLFAMAVIFYGARQTWRLLPIPVRIRSMLARKKDLWGALLWGLIMLAGHYRLPGSWHGWRDSEGTLLGTAVGCLIIYLFDISRSDPPREPVERECDRPGI